MGYDILSGSKNDTIRARLEAPHREFGEDAPVKGGGKTPPEKSLEARKTRQPEPTLLKIGRWDTPGKDSKVEKLRDLFVNMRKGVATSPKGGTVSPTSDGKMAVETLRGQIKESAALLEKIRVKAQESQQPSSKSLDDLLGELLSMESPKAPKDQAPKTVSPTIVTEETPVKTQEPVQLSSQVLDDLLAELQAWGTPKALSADFVNKITTYLDWQPSSDTVPVTANTAATASEKDLALTAKTLMRKAEDAQILAVDLLMQRREQLGGEFASMTREQMFKAANDAPLARLSAEDRMHLSMLRAKHREIMTTANSIIDALEAKDTAKALKPEVKRLNTAAKTYEKQLSELIKKAPDKANWQSLLTDAGKGKIVSFTDTRIGHLLAGCKTIYTREVLAHSIAGLFNVLGMLRRDAAVLGTGSKTALATKTIREASEAARLGFEVKASTNPRSLLKAPSIALGLGLLKQSTATQLPISQNNDFVAGLAAKCGGNDPIFEIALGEGALRPAPKTDVGVQKMLAEIMPLPAKRVPAGQEAQEINSFVWKLNNSMRFNVDKRLYMGLSPDMRQQFALFAFNAPLSQEGKHKLYLELVTAFDAHFPTVPEELDVVSENVGSGKSAPKIVRMDGWDRPVLLKNVGDFNERIRELAYNSLMGDNPNVPKVLGVALPKNKTLKNKNTKIIFEIVPGKDLSSFIPGMSGTPKDSLLTSMSPLARAKAAVYLISGAVRGLAPLHAMGLAHCDIKPGNIMLHDKTLEPCLIDFGSMGRPGEYGSMTPGYVSLDEYTASPAVDIFSLGRTLMELAYSKPKPGLSGMGYLQAIAQDSYWQENGEIGQIFTAANILSHADAKKRPTMDQLLAVIEGRKEVPRATDQGGASQDDLAVLRNVFGPQGLFTGGRDEIAGQMQ